MGEFDNKEIPSPIVQVQEEERPCPVCGEPAEPEIDGDHRYWECANDDCEAPGYAFGYEKVEEGTRIEGNCSVGVPESVRRAASAPMEGAISAERQAQPVDLGLTIGRRPTED